VAHESLLQRVFGLLALLNALMRSIHRRIFTVRPRAIVCRHHIFCILVFILV